MKNQYVIPAKAGIQVRLSGMFGGWIPAFAGMTSVVTLILCWPIAASAQSFVNPDTIYQAGDIYLQNTDVYYNPFSPPGDSDTRENLCNESDQIRDPNGIGNPYGEYLPVIYDTVAHTFDTLRNWAPHGTPIGETTVWQRLFTARDKPDHSHSDIIVGSHVTNDTAHSRGYGPVIISQNEDVDFRASGTVKMENGFHVKPGAFFHAYQEPRWGTTAFSDEFDDPAKFGNHWEVGKGYGRINSGAECSFDSNAVLVTDTDAHDGHAIDIILREDSCNCNTFNPWVTNDSCNGDQLADSSHPHFAFSSASLLSCPFPYLSTSGPPNREVYEHAPYGKYEFREKIPHTMFHANNWGLGDAEYDLNETWGGAMQQLHPGWNHGLSIGPFHGIFKNIGGDSILFISPTAGWNKHNYTYYVIIDNFLYGVHPFGDDTVMALDEDHQTGGFPPSLYNRTDSVTFYYKPYSQHSSDSVTWHVDSTRRIFSAPYAIHGTDSSWFTRDYQPTSLTFEGYTPLGADTIKTHACHWVDSINHPNQGKIYLDDPIDTLEPHSGNQEFRYTIGGSHYPVPAVAFDGNDTVTGYTYHTFTMEWLPHEVRMLYDSNVVRRWPDRLVPPGNKYYNYVSTCSRTPANIYPAQFDIDWNNNDYDPMGTDSSWFLYEGVIYYNSISYVERHYFETHTNNPGFWPVDGKPAPHYMIDYIKIFDIPSDVTIPAYPH